MSHIASIYEDHSQPWREPFVWKVEHVSQYSHADRWFETAMEAFEYAVEMERRRRIQEMTPQRPPADYSELHDEQDDAPPPPLYKHSPAECEASKEQTRQQLLAAGVSPDRWDFDGVGCSQCDYDEAPPAARERGVPA